MGSVGKCGWETSYGTWQVFSRFGMLSLFPFVSSTFKLPTTIYNGLLQSEFDCVDHNELWKILKEMGIPNCLLRICMQVKKQQLELDIEQQTGSKSTEEYIKAVYCHPAYLTHMQSVSWEMLDWMNHKLESRLPGEISITSDMQRTPPLWQKVKKN